MRIRVRYFAAAREATGHETETLEVDAEADVAALRRELLARHPRLEGLPLRIAVGQAFAAEDTPLREEEEVALIPPVSGG